MTVTLPSHKDLFPLLRGRVRCGSHSALDTGLFSFILSHVISVSFLLKRHQIKLRPRVRSLLPHKGCEMVAVNSYCCTDIIQKFVC